MQNIEQWGVIINPYAGTRQLQKDWKKIYQLLSSAKIRFESQLTAYPNHATDIVRDMISRGIDHILVVGGDGTLNEAIQGVDFDNTNNNRITFAIIPYGTGNDWARYWKLKSRGRGGVDHLLSRNIVTVDVGKLTYKNKKGEDTIRYFLNGVGVGFDGKVCQVTDKIKKFFGGASWVYKLSLILAVLKYKPHVMTYSDGNEIGEEKLLSISIGNNCYSGGGIKQTPQADPTDGVFHTSVIIKPPLRRIPKAIYKLFKGVFNKSEIVTTFVSEKFYVDSKESVLFEVDGILLEGRLPLKTEILSHAINFILPKRRK